MSMGEMDIIQLNLNVLLINFKSIFFECDVTDKEDRYPVRRRGTRDAM